MRKFIILAAAVSALATAACGNKRDEGDAALVNEAVNTDASMAGMNADNGMAAAATSDADFANTIAAGGKFEIESGTLAGTQATSPALKSLAAMIVADHKKANTELKAAAAEANPPVTPAEELTPKQTADLATLKAAKGTDFDRTYVTQQIAAHEEALAALNGYASNGATPSLKAFAAKTATAVQTHLDKLNALPK